MTSRGGKHEYPCRRCEVRPQPDRVSTGKSAAQPADEDHAKADQPHSQRLRNGRGHAQQGHGHDEHDNRRHTAGDGIDEAHVRASIGGRQQVEVDELQDGRGGDERPRLGLHVPAQQCEGRGHGHANGNRYGRCCLVVLTPCNDEIPKRMDYRRAKGDYLPLESPDTALAYPYSPIDRERIAQNRSRLFVGTPATIRQKLAPLLDATQADELMITSMIYDHEARKRSYTLLAQAFGVKA